MTSVEEITDEETLQDVQNVAMKSPSLRELLYPEATLVHIR